MIETEPNAPAMVIKHEGKQESHDKQDCNYKLIVRIDNWQGNQVSKQNYKFRRDHANQDRANKEAFLALENRPTEITTISYVE